MNKKNEVVAVLDEIVKYYIQSIRCMQLMVEKGDANYGGVDVEETINAFTKNAKKWHEHLEKLRLIKNDVFDNCSDETVGLDILIEERNNIKKNAEAAQDVCKKLYGCYYE